MNVKTVVAVFNKKIECVAEMHLFFKCEIDGKKYLYPEIEKDVLIVYPGHTFKLINIDSTLTTKAEMSSLSRKPIKIYVDPEYKACTDKIIENCVDYYAASTMLIHSTKYKYVFEDGFITQGDHLVAGVQVIKDTKEIFAHEKAARAQAIKIPLRYKPQRVNFIY